MNYKEKNIAIIGEGLEGVDAKKFLKKHGAKVTVLDQKQGKNYLDNLERFDIVVRSPGVYPYKKELNKARKKGIRITTPTHIFFDEFKGQIIGVTGTKGKGTTSTLIYNILKKAGFDVYLGGNIGKPLLQLLSKLNSKSYVVMEMSSFQLIDLPLSPNIAVVLNITSDHMDWHKNQKEYIEAKKNIVKYQNISDWAVVNSEYKIPNSFAKSVKSNVILYSKNILPEEYKTDLILRGQHNLENIAAAVAVGKILNIDKNVIIKTVRKFKGLEHRLEFVKEVGGVKFYNDSFATGPQPTIAAIKSFTEDETLILGGSDKGLEYRDLGIEIEKHKNIKNLILIGTTKLKIRNSLKITRNAMQSNLKLKILDLDKSKMNKIVEMAYRITKPGGVVILSPASASFDMFENYKDRGHQFKNAVLNLSP